MANDKLVWTFGNGTAEGGSGDRELLGGKGANLAEMSSLGVPVPAGFTIATTACAEYQTRRDGLWPSLQKQITAAIAETETRMGARYGDPKNPLLLSVRSGAAVSMPGMMDTVLNLGLNQEVARGLIEKTGNARFVWDCYRRLVDMFGDVVMGVPHARFEEKLVALKKARGKTADAELDAADFEELTGTFLAVYEEHVGAPFPSDPREQLERAICAVFDSWNAERAVAYRRIHNIAGLTGTAVNVQSMVFGNLGETSGTGVLFTRDPSSGEKTLFGEYLVNAQGEDVVAGIRTPEPIANLERDMPEVYRELVGITDRLERHYRDMQDIEFTVQDGKLYILQTRGGKRGGHAAVRIAVEMVNEKLATPEEAIAKLIDPEHIDQLMHPRFASEESYRKEGLVVGTGIAAAPGAAVGRAVFCPADAEREAKKGTPVILVRLETSAEDVAGMHAARGILTGTGGMTSHAAVVARGWGKPCVVGCSDITVDEQNARFTVGDRVVSSGDWVSINGTTGEVVLGQCELVDAEMDDDFRTVMTWVDEHARLEVRANADTPEDARRARELGAKGIGLCRTEHMFFAPDRILAMREMIVAESLEDRRKALDKLLPMQRGDFAGMFRAMSGLPVTIRLLDPPLHEFLPEEEEQQREVAHDLGIDAAAVRARVQALHETNPMLGHRGCRLGITHPEITEMQARAIFQAACEAAADGSVVCPEVMVPLVGRVEEFRHQRAIIDRVAGEVFAETRASVPYRVGTMIEVPRAALTAGKIAKEAEFFSFGTNDLTQMTLAYSRDDFGHFLGDYETQGVLGVDPFVSVDEEGVGQLVELAVKRGREARPDLHTGICGEHGGDPRSVDFFHRAGLDYVSCSTFRVPVARMAAARAALR